MDRLPYDVNTVACIAATVAFMAVGLCVRGVRTILKRRSREPHG